MGQKHPKSGFSRCWGPFWAKRPPTTFDRTLHAGAMNTVWGPMCPWGPRYGRPFSGKKKSDTNKKSEKCCFCCFAVSKKTSFRRKRSEFGRVLVFRLGDSQNPSLAYLCASLGLGCGRPSLPLWPFGTVKIGVRLGGRTGEPFPLPFGVSVGVFSRCLRRVSGLPSLNLAGQGGALRGSLGGQPQPPPRCPHCPPIQATPVW